MEIGFIGLGSMGGPMSRRLVEAGHKLTVFDTRKEAMEPLIKLGAEAARKVGTLLAYTWDEWGMDVPAKAG